MLCNDWCYKSILKNANYINYKLGIIKGKMKYSSLVSA